MRTLRTSVLFLAIAALTVSCGQGTEPERINELSAEELFQAGGRLDDIRGSLEIKIEDAIALCMQRSGHEYVPQTRSTSSTDEVNDGFYEFEWRAEYGYGISTTIYEGLAQEIADPNVGIFQRLSESGREEWRRSLLGHDGERVGPVPGGCVGDAFNSTGAQELLGIIDEGSAEYLRERESILARPEIIDAMDRWSMCMREAGFEKANTPSGLRDQIDGQLAVLLQPARDAANGFTADEFARRTSNSAASLEERFPEIDWLEMKRLNDREVATAMADYRCYESTLLQSLDPLLEAAADAIAATKSDEMLDLLGDFG